MIEPDYQALGRYTHLCELVAKAAGERGQLLTRAATVLQNAARPRPASKPTPAAATSPRWSGCWPRPAWSTNACRP
ncbi:hypothetical protein D3C84_439130 [compost metagenome]